MKQFSCGDVVPNYKFVVVTEENEQVTLPSVAASHPRRDLALQEIPEALVLQARSLARESVGA